MENNFISNGKIKLAYSLKGGWMTSIFDLENNIERQYQPREDAWMGQDVVIFPFIARLIDKTYTVNGKTYSMDNHGLCRYNNFEVKEKSSNRVVLSFDSNEETLKQYPYEFNFEVIYTLENRTVNIEYKVKNTCKTPMFFGIGGHPALKVSALETKNETILDGTKVVFDEELDLTQMTLTDDGSFITGEKSFGKVKEIPITKELFRKEKTLMLKAEKIKRCILIDKDGNEVHYSWPSINYLAIWSHPHFGDYVCVEPWMSLPDFVGSSKELSQKKTLISLNPNETYSFIYSIKI